MKIKIKIKIKCENDLPKRIIKNQRSYMNFDARDNNFEVLVINQ